MNEARGEIERPNAREPEEPGWAQALGCVFALVALPPFLALSLFAAVVVWPIVMVYDHTAEPWVFRRRMARLGRVMTRVECVEHVSRGEGTVLIEVLSRWRCRVWWTPEIVAPLAADLAQFKRGKAIAEADLARLIDADKKTRRARRRYFWPRGKRGAMLVNSWGAEVFSDNATNPSMHGQEVRFEVWNTGVSEPPESCQKCG